MSDSLKRLIGLAVATIVSTLPLPAQFACADLPSHAELTSALKSSIAPTGGPSNGGFDFHAWAALVDRDGRVCAVTKSGANRGDQFPISRLAAVQKATTANAISLDGLAISTANGYFNVQPGGQGFTLPNALPVDPRVVYPDAVGDSSALLRFHGTFLDPLVGKIAGGFSVLAGGLSLYNSDGKVVGGLGVGGDATACADHNIAWRVRSALGLDNVNFGLNPQNGDDGIVYDVGPDGVSASGVGYPFCGFNEPQVAVEIGAGSIPAAP